MNANDDMPERRKPGRPPGRKCTEVARIYLEPDEHALLKKLAAGRGISVSALMRELAHEEAIRVHQRTELERTLDHLTPEEVQDYIKAIRRENEEPAE